MAGHPYISSIQDRAAQGALLNALGIIAKLEARVAALEASALTSADNTIDAQSKRIANLADPQDEQDACTVAFVRQLMEAQVETF